ncbi:hypothetical protein [Nocardiopsis ansamitocini]|uniref:Uncharacterized protein n=1 Tax=Nocardiopsis ansamitocini TaxID=1670832 RepID=A0A9W6UIH8_9ACTN|nr:hypothetical protein [Nocardiopsis ansamitocini]GLU49951.1 hypothetical protein Nans01_43020 [Nocardiopsis ansamitocini]
MDTSVEIAAALARVRWDFPDWAVTQDDRSDTTWSAHRTVPLTRAEHRAGRSRRLCAETSDGLLVRLGREQRALDEHHIHHRGR